MDDTAWNKIRQLTRNDLERFAFHAALQIRTERREVEQGRLFLAVLTGFLLGAIVAYLGFLMGVGLG